MGRAPLVPVSQLTREDIALQGFSRDEDQDGQIDPLPAHLQPALPAQQPAFQQPQQFQQPASSPSNSSPSSNLLLSKPASSHNSNHSRSQRSQPKFIYAK